MENFAVAEQCICTSGSLRISLPHLDPEKYQLFFKAQPDYSFKKGDMKEIHSPIHGTIKRVRQFGYICYTTPDNENNIGFHLQALVDKLGKPPEAYYQIVNQEQPDLTIVLFVCFNDKKINKTEYENFIRNKYQNIADLYKARIDLDWSAC